MWKSLILEIKEPLKKIIYLNLIRKWLILKKYWIISNIRIYFNNKNNL